MTYGESRRRGLADGCILKLLQAKGIDFYLADWAAKPNGPTTPYPFDARWFRSSAEARDCANLLDMVTEMKWVAVVPPSATQFERTEPKTAGHVFDTCPACGHHLTCGLADGTTRCYACGLSRAAGTKPAKALRPIPPELAPLRDPNLTDEQAEACLREAIETFKIESAGGEET